MIIWSLTCQIYQTDNIVSDLESNSVRIMKILKVKTDSFTGQEEHTANRIVFAIMDEETETLLRLKYGYVFQVHKGW
jgi:hypothetical protein